MRMQDLKWWTDPIWSYGQWLSQGEESDCQAFHDNPGNTANWNNTYEQWTANEAFEAYKVHGGPKSILKNLAKYSECDVKGTLAKFDTNHNGTIEYSAGTLPGNDADSVAFQQYGTRPQDRTETSFWYSGAKAAAEEHQMLGDDAKATEMSGIADNIKTGVINLWANDPISTPGGAATGPRADGKIGKAVKLGGTGEWITLPNNVTGTLNGDNRFPDNNEYFFNWDPVAKTLGRSGIHHDVLGSFNWIMFQDVAGITPRLDDVIELSPIDWGYDHVTVNNLSYHGTSLTVVWQKPGHALLPAGA